MEVGRVGNPSLAPPEGTGLLKAPARGRVANPSYNGPPRYTSLNPALEGATTLTHHPIRATLGSALKSFGFAVTLAWRSPSQRIQQEQEFVEVGGLGQVLVEARVEGTPADLRPGIPGEGH